MSKGQIFITDFVASIGLFIIMLAIFGTLWNSSVDVFSTKVDTQHNQHTYSFNLLQTSGYPSKWNSSNVEIPGIYKKDYLSAEKFLKLKKMSNNEKNKLFNVNNFQISVLDTNKKPKKYNGTILETNSTNISKIPDSKTIYTSKKYTLLRENQEKVLLRYNTWK